MPTVVKYGWFEVKVRPMLHHSLNREDGMARMIDYISICSYCDFTKPSIPLKSIFFSYL